MSGSSDASVFVTRGGLVCFGSAPCARVLHWEATAAFVDSCILAMGRYLVGDMIRSALTIGAPPSFDGAPISPNIRDEFLGWMTLNA